jgi:surfactin synthase thioesterase subunit
MAGMTGYLAAPCDPAAPLRLFCFHPAGAGAASFAGWRQALGPGIDVLPVRLPGRETRFREARFTDAAVLIGDLAARLAPALDERPYAFYGHSMGAQVAYQLARRRRDAGARGPEILCVGACPAPHVPTHAASLPDAPDHELVRVLASLGAVPPGSSLSRGQVVRRMLPIVRDDLRLFAGGMVTGPPLDCPVQVLAATDDPLFDSAAAQAWADHTTASCAVHLLRGGHFFHRAPSFPWLLRGLLPVPANNQGTAAR